MRHPHERCEEHKFNSSGIKKHFTNKHDCLPDNTCINQHFKVLRKCKTHHDRLIYEKPLINEIRFKTNAKGTEQITNPDLDSQISNPVNLFPERTH